MAQDTRGRLAVLGLGYVGLPLAMCAVEVGYDVVGFDVNKTRVDRLQRGSTFIDDISDDDIAQAVASGRFRPTTDATRARRVRRRRGLGPDTAARRGTRPELRRGRGAYRRSARPARIAA